MKGLLWLCLALALPAASAEGGAVEAKRAAMERLRARTAALEDAAADLERLAADHGRDRPAPPAADRSSLRARVEQGAADLKLGMEGYWELDALERVEKGSALLGAFFTGIPEAKGERAIRTLADLGDFPKTVESAIGRAETVLRREDAAFKAAQARRAEDARRRTMAWVGGAALAGLLVAAAWVYRPIPPKKAG